MTKREAELLELVVRQNYELIADWLPSGCAGTLWGWHQMRQAQGRGETETELLEKWPVEAGILYDTETLQPTG